MWSSRLQKYGLNQIVHRNTDHVIKSFTEIRTRSVKSLREIQIMWSNRLLKYGLNQIVDRNTYHVIKPFTKIWTQSNHWKKYRSCDQIVYRNSDSTKSITEIQIIWSNRSQKYGLNQITDRNTDHVIKPFTAIWTQSNGSQKYRSCESDRL